jgi:hypothetical protein
MDKTDGEVSGCGCPTSRAAPSASTCGLMVGQKQCGGGYFTGVDPRQRFVAGRANLVI